MSQPPRRPRDYDRCPQRRRGRIQGGDRAARRSAGQESRCSRRQGTGDAPDRPGRAGVLPGRVGRAGRTGSTTRCARLPENRAFVPQHCTKAAIKRRRSLPSRSMQLSRRWRCGGPDLTQMNGVVCGRGRCIGVSGAETADVECCAVQGSLFPLPGGRRHRHDARRRRGREGVYCEFVHVGLGQSAAGAGLPQSDGRVLSDVPDRREVCDQHPAAAPPGTGGTVCATRRGKIHRRRISSIPTTACRW